ncbi:hypothetical protein MSG28_013262 [Choristoneura fumiferana]|uniref:Uncharacterized protein n=1 Tax=Choristoneura fumiferana TaxID=7141 RepID=A0ACC0KSA6_CHOFU|nr:hypothetical protein MSG28_013262 [Choristoneura fumiferana]
MKSSSSSLPRLQTALQLRRVYIPDSGIHIYCDFLPPQNSLSLDMMSHLIQAINTNKEDTSLRAIVLSAKGNVFSAGHNLKELQSSTGIDQHKLVFQKATELMKSIVQSPVPVIAKVNGLPLTAQEAYDSGLVTKVAPADQLDEEVDKIVESIKHKSRSVIALGKQFYYKQIDLSLLEAYDLGENIMVENINMNDGQEGIKSFVEKRKANWNHKYISSLTLFFYYNPKS